MRLLANSPFGSIPPNDESNMAEPLRRATPGSAMLLQFPERFEPSR
jgi:hypothetical protein